MTETHHKKVSLRVVREHNRRLQRTMRLISVQISADIREAIKQMQIYGISQLPVLDGERVVGRLDERALLERLTTAELCLWGNVAAFMQPPLPSLDEDAALEEALALLRAGAAGVIVMRGGAPAGILTSSAWSAVTCPASPTS